MPRLTKAIGADVEIYAKRDDCNSGLAMGGNKLRKLEYIIPDAISSGADTLVSIGGVQSNHTRMVAATAAKIGMKCVVVQESWVPHDDAVYDRVGNILLTRLMGADSRLVDEGFDIGIRKSWEDALCSLFVIKEEFLMLFQLEHQYISMVVLDMLDLQKKLENKKIKWELNLII